jgi:hypothetical protein
MARSEHVPLLEVREETAALLPHIRAALPAPYPGDPGIEQECMNKM